MSISIGNDSGYLFAQANDSVSKGNALEQKLSKDLSKASDEELYEACKSFESYLVEQVIKSVKKTVAPSEEDENEYISYFGDNIYQQYAKDITESGELGIAQQLYESMKRNQ